MATISDCTNCWYISFTSSRKRMKEAYTKSSFSSACRQLQYCIVARLISPKLYSDVAETTNCVHGTLHKTSTSVQGGCTTCTYNSSGCANVCLYLLYQPLSQLYILYLCCHVYTWPADRWGLGHVTRCMQFKQVVQVDGWGCTALQMVIIHSGQNKFSFKIISQWYIIIIRRIAIGWWFFQNYN